MKKRNRDIQIFNLSALDLFCSAMGAIMVLMVLLMPYYMRPKPDELVQMRNALETARGQIDGLKSQVDSMRSERDAAARDRDAAIRKLENPFIVVAVSWDLKGADVDLHVKAPGNRHYWYRQRSHPGSQATLEVDSLNGPGNEVWINQAAGPGEYMVEYVYYAAHEKRDPVTVRGVVVHRDGKQQLSPQSLAAPNENFHLPVCTVEVGAGGNVTIR